MKTMTHSKRRTLDRKMYPAGVSTDDVMKPAAALTTTAPTASADTTFTTPSVCDFAAQLKGERMQRRADLRRKYVALVA